LAVADLDESEKLGGLCMLKKLFSKASFLHLFAGMVVLFLLLIINLKLFPREVVLTSGTAVSLYSEAPSYEVKISCPIPFIRDVSINGERHILLIEKRDERWFGGYGVTSYWRNIFHPKKRFFYEEGLQHFYNREEALDWLQRQKKSSNVFCSKTGVVFSLTTSSIKLWQICVSGEILTDFSEDCGQIELTGQVECKTLKGFFPAKPITVEGVYFTGRVQDLMKEADVTFEEVIQVIKNGEDKVLSDGAVVYEDGPVTKYGFIDPFRSIRAYVDPQERVFFLRTGGLR
jgi:hypothetical protein